MLLSMDDSPYRAQAQAEVDGLLQGRTRLFALGLGGLNALVGLLNLVFLPHQSFSIQAPMALMTLGAMLALAHWLRQPQPPYLVHFAGGTAAMLAVTAALIHLSLSGDFQNTTHLLLIVIGAGFFLFSLPWYSALATLVGLGWLGVVYAMDAPGFPLHYAIEVGTAILLGLLIHLVRRNLLHRFLELLVQNRQHEAEQAQLLAELREAMESVKTLRGLVPICAECKKIRDDQGFWQQVEDFIHEHSEAVFSHSLCPICLAKAKAEFEAFQQQQE